MGTPTERAESRTGAGFGPQGGDVLDARRSDGSMGRFRVLNVLARPGGEADLYRCQDLDNGGFAAAKLYRVTIEPDAVALDRIAQLDTTYVLSLIAYGDFNGRFLEISEVAEGGTLQDRLLENGQFTEANLFEDVIPQVFGALQTLHTNDLIHRDIRPENLFYRDAARRDIVVGDFGLTSAVRAGAASHMTRRLGLSQDYSAPELTPIVGGAEAVFDHTVDYYAFGLTLITLLTGKPIFAGMLTSFVHHRKMRGEVPWPACSPRLLNLLQGLLYPNPRQRWRGGEVDAWRKGRTVDVPNYDLVRPTLQYTIGNRIASSRPELAHLLYVNFEKGLEHLTTGLLSDALTQQDQELAMIVRRAQNQSPTPESALIQIIYTLDPSLPYRLLDDVTAANAQELARAIDLNNRTRAAGMQQLFDGRLLAWLRATGLMNTGRMTHGEISNLWNSVRQQFAADQNAGLEHFLHMLDATLPAPSLHVTPSHFNLGRIRAGETRTAALRIQNRGRGHLAGTITLDPAIAGVSLSADRFAGNETTIEIGVKPEGMRRALHTDVLLTSNAGPDLRIPIACTIRRSIEQVARWQAAVWWLVAVTTLLVVTVSSVTSARRQSRERLLAKRAPVQAAISRFFAPGALLTAYHRPDLYDDRYPYTIRIPDHGLLWKERSDYRLRFQTVAKFSWDHDKRNLSCSNATGQPADDLLIIGDLVLAASDRDKPFKALTRVAVRGRDGSFSLCVPGDAAVWNGEGFVAEENDEPDFVLAYGTPLGPHKHTNWSGDPRAKQPRRNSGVGAAGGSAVRTSTASPDNVKPESAISGPTSITRQTTSTQAVAATNAAPRDPKADTSYNQTVSAKPSSQVVRTDEIHFEPGSARLTNIAKAILAEIALVMEAEPHTTARITGHIDSRESTGPHPGLDILRAESASTYLVQAGSVEPSRIVTLGYGTAESVADNTTPEGRLRNRRIVIRLQLPEATGTGNTAESGGDVLASEKNTGKTPPAADPPATLSSRDVPIYLQPPKRRRPPA